MNLAEKIVRAKADLDAAYEAGKAAVSGDNYYDTFWESYQNNGNRVDYAYGFAGDGWNDGNYRPKYLIKPKDTYMMFARTRISKTSGIDFSEATSFDYSFYYSNFLKEVDVGSIPKVKSFNMSFSSGVIETVRMRDIDEACTFSNTFKGASQLVNVDTTGSIGSDISFVDCKKLNRLSMDSIRDHLSDNVTGKTCTFSQVAVFWAGFDKFGTDGFTPGVDAGIIADDVWVAWKSVKPNWTITYL